jgi:mercuric ion transport protein
MKEKVTLSASLLAAITASLCCVGPLAAVLIGLGSFGAAAVFEAGRPYFLALSFLLLAGAFYFTYRKPKTACADGTCQTAGASRWNKASLWLVAGLVILFAAFPYYSGALMSALNRDSSQVGAVSAQIADLTNLDQLKQRFQGDNGKVRLITLLSPT